MRIAPPRVVIAVILAVGTFSSVRHAYADDVATARMHYERGTALYDLQRYLDAAKEYEAAFEAKNDPALLFNIAQAYRFGGDYAKAIAAFRSFLRRVPSAENRGEVEQRIAELQKLLEEQKRNQLTPPTGTLKPGTTTPTPEPVVTPPPNPPPTTTTAAGPVPQLRASDRPGRVKLIVGISIAAVGVASLATGGAFEGLAASDNRALSNPMQGMVFDPSREKALKNEQAAGAALLAVGGAAVVTGTALIILGSHERKAASRVAVSPHVSHTTVGVVVDARF